MVLFGKEKSSLQSGGGGIEKKKGKDVAVRKSDRRQLLQRVYRVFGISENNNNNDSNDTRTTTTIVAEILQHVFLQGPLTQRTLVDPTTVDASNNSSSNNNNKKNTKKSEKKVLVYYRGPDEDNKNNNNNESSTKWWPYRRLTQAVWIEFDRTDNAAPLPTVALLSVLPPESILSDRRIMTTVTVFPPVSRYICRGANVMKAGVAKIEMGSSSSCCAVYIQRNPQPFAVGFLTPTTATIDNYGPGTQGMGVLVDTCYGDDLWKQQLPTSRQQQDNNSSPFDLGHYGNPGFLDGQVVVPTQPKNTSTDTDTSESDDEDKLVEQQDAAAAAAYSQTETPFTQETESTILTADQNEVPTTNATTTADQNEVPTTNATTTADQNEVPTTNATTTADQNEVPTTNATTTADQNEVPTMTATTAADQNEVPTTTTATATTTTTDDNQDEETTTTAASPDDILHEAVCRALVQLHPKRDLPMNMATFYSQYVLKATSTTVELKKTRYKKFGVYIQTQVNAGLIQVKAKNDDPWALLIGYNRKHKDVISYLQQCKQEQQQQQGSTTAAGPRKLVLVELYCVPHHFVDLLKLDPKMVQAVNASSEEQKNTGMLTSKEVRAILEDYVEREQLVNPSNQAMVILNGPLTDALFASKKKKKNPANNNNNTTMANNNEQQQPPPPATLSRKELAAAWQTKMELAYALVELPGNQVIKSGRGRPPFITIEVVQRQSRSVTKIRGTEAYGVSAEELRHELATRFACAVTLKETTFSNSNNNNNNQQQQQQPKTRVELLLQGNWVDAVKALLVGNPNLCDHGGVKDSPYQLPSNAMEILLRKRVPARKKRATLKKK